MKKSNFYLKKKKLNNQAFWYAIMKIEFFICIVIIWKSKKFFLSLNNAKGTTDNS